MCKMRLLTTKFRRHRAAPPLQHFLCHYTSSATSNSSNSLSSRSIHRHRQNKWLRNYNPRWSPDLSLLSPHDSVYFSRRFSTQPSFSEPGDPIFPVQVIISALNSYHEVTGFPWWIVISSSTLAMRLALFPTVVLQLRKLKTIGEFMSKLPPPFPPPLSGKSYRDQFALFWKEKKASECPSVFWFFSSFVIQVPCFFLLLGSVRKMSLDHYPGFDTGGVLWFQNLTEYPHGMLGPVLPLVIAGLHFTVVQTTFKNSPLEKAPASLRLLAKLYQRYLQVLTIPILYATFNVPQGSLVYWITNSSLSLTQLLFLRHPAVLEYFGLPIRNAPEVVPSNKEIQSSGVADIVLMTKEGEVPADTLSPPELVSYSIKILSDGHKDVAMKLLRLALEKDPEHVRALLILGQTMLQNKQFAEAAEYLENAISKLLADGCPTEVEEVDLLILSSQWAGIANAHQGKMEESLVHLERIAHLEEPDDSKSKAHYYDGLLILSSALLTVDRKEDAAKYLHKAVAYDPSYSVYLEHLESDPTDIASDLARTRR